MRLSIVLTMMLFHCVCFAQAEYKRIKVTNDIELVKLSENAYMHCSYAELPNFGRFSSNGLVFINGSEAFLFDTPVNDSLTAILYEWLTDTMKLKISGFVPNHWHQDCMGGLSFIQSQKIKSFASQTTIDIAKSKNLPVPDFGFVDSLMLMLGNKCVMCYYLGAAHSMDNIVVWIPSEKILFAGCMAKSLNSANLGNTADGDLKAYAGTIEKVLSKFTDAKIVIPGHGNFGGTDLLKHTLKLAKK